MDNAYVIQVETLRLVSKLNKKWTNIYIIPIEKYVCKQAELVSKCCMDVLDKKLTDMVEILYTNPKSCFGRKMV